MSQGPVLPRGYRYEWELFSDWCAGAESSSLPASPVTVALFLEENPAGSDALRRRVAAINLVHRSSGHPAPGTVTAIRLQLDRARAARVAERRVVVAPIITGLPTSGWPNGMFGRRDALILALHSAGLRPTDIAALDRGDLTADGDSVRVGKGHHLRLVNTLPGVVSIDFVSVWRNWEHVLQVVDRYPSTRVVEGHLRSGGLPDLGAAGSAPGSGPMMVPIDRWGALPLPPRAMTPAAVSTVLTGHLSGTAPPHRSVPVRRAGAALEAGNGSDPVEAPGVVDYGSGTRLVDTHAAGIAARHAAHSALADVAGVFDDVEDRVDALLRRTLELLDDSVESSEIPRP